MGEYVEELLKSIVGKTFFELLILYSSDIEKRKTLFPRLRFKQSLEYAQNRIMEYTLSKIETRVFRPKIPVGAILILVSLFIDGIAQRVVFNAAGNDNNGVEPEADIKEMFQTLATVVVNLLEV